jgi:hypothetical protein
MHYRLGAVKRRRSMSNLGDALENEIRKKVKREVDKKFSINLYKDGYTLEQIADIGELSVDEVKELVSENKPVNEQVQS